jgi:excisionase family DNA binding protein
MFLVITFLLSSLAVLHARSTRLTLEPAAKFLGITPRHLRRLVQERRVGHSKIGGRLVFDVERDLEPLLEKTRREALR